MSMSARVILDSIGPNDVRLTTFELTLPRIVLAEFNTHRMLCLAGDSVLEFDLPSAKTGRKLYKMRLDEFVDKWTGGARREGSNPKQDLDTSWAEDAAVYSTYEVASRLGMANTSPVNRACREGDLKAFRRDGDRAWWTTGADVKRWRRTSPEHTRFDMRARLAGMRIRQFNEATQDIQWSHVVNAVYSGVKEVFELRAGDYVVAGSKDHLILTSRGWQRIEDIQVGEFIVVRKFGKHEDERADPLRLKKIDGRWRSGWQRKMRDELAAQDPVCRKCRHKSGVCIHHIVPVYEAPELAFDAKNITLLCEFCHESEHEKQGWQGGTYLYGGMAEVREIRARGLQPTYDLEIAGAFPNFIANGVVVHNSRNSASSRAIPFAKMVERVRHDPFVPKRWPRNQKGMQATEYLEGKDEVNAEALWKCVRSDVVGYAQGLADLDVHKAICNRLLEPFLFHTIVFTATELENFYALRADKMAQDEIREPTEMLIEAYEKSTPMQLKSGEWHLPFVTDYDLFREENGQWSARHDEAGRISDKGTLELVDPDWLYWTKISAARCARVTHLNHEGKRDLVDDEALYKRLVQPGHMSPLEHPAQALTREQWRVQATEMASDWIYDRVPVGNFWGWLQFRKTIEHEHNAKELRAARDKVLLG